MIRTFQPGTLGEYDYVVMLSRYQGKYLLSRHKGRSTWELQGGHIEPGETPEQAARRELYEESGALCFELVPLCDYCGEEPGRNNAGSGMVFEVNIHMLGSMPEFEMDTVQSFESIPDELTYPEITAAIMKFRSEALISS